MFVSLSVLCVSLYVCLLSVSVCIFVSLYVLCIGRYVCRLCQCVCLSVCCLYHYQSLFFLPVRSLYQSVSSCVLSSTRIFVCSLHQFVCVFVSPLSASVCMFVPYNNFFACLSVHSLCGSVCLSVLRVSLYVSLSVSVCPLYQPVWFPSYVSVCRTLFDRC